MKFLLKKTKSSETDTHSYERPPPTYRIYNLRATLSMREH